MGRKLYLKILCNVGVGKKTVWLISRFWKQGLLCCQAAGYYGQTFRARSGIPHHL